MFKASNETGITTIIWWKQIDSFYWDRTHDFSVATSQFAKNTNTTVLMLALWSLQWRIWILAQYDPNYMGGLS